MKVVFIEKAIRNFWNMTDGKVAKKVCSSPGGNGPREYQFISLDSTLESPPNYDVGIEITLPHLQLPQAKFLTHPTVIEQAVNLILPPNGATIAVADECNTSAIGAAAILYNRGRHVPNKLRVVSILATGGCYGVATVPSNWHHQVYRAISMKVANLQLTLLEKVVWLANVLFDGRIPESELRSLLTIRDQLFAKAQRESIVWLTEDKRICVVESTHRFAPKIGYQHANIVLALNREYPVDTRDHTKGTYLKYTICKFNPYVAVNLQGALDALNELEKARLNDGRTWGGRAEIIGSPHGRSSTVTLSEVLSVVKANLYDSE